MRCVVCRVLALVAALWLMTINVALAAPDGLPERLANLEQTSGGRLGVVLLDTGSGQQWGYRADQRFAMCSTFKALLAAAVLKAVEQGRLELDQPITYEKSDLLEYAPATRRHLEQGSMSVRALIAAAVTLSDNTAANLLLAQIGGPQGLTEFLRGIGDATTRLDRIEPFLNSNLPGDERDTSTPEAMAATLAKLLTGSALEEGSRHRLINWMVNNKTGDRRIRAGLDASWVVGDKTGTGENGAANDVAIIWPPGEPPLILVVFYTGAPMYSA